MHVLDGAIQPWARLKGFAPHVKAHLSVLAALIVLTCGFRYWIDIYELNFSPTGQIIGAGYTDIHAQIPAYTHPDRHLDRSRRSLLLANIRFQGWRLPGIALGVWLAASILLGRRRGRRSCSSSSSPRTRRRPRRPTSSATSP